MRQREAAASFRARAIALALPGTDPVTKKPTPKKPAAKMPTKKPQQTVHPKAILNMARDYADAANELFISGRQTEN
jgi:hypothetical protein